MTGALDYTPTLRPKWTGTAWAQYDSGPVFGEASISARVDANFRSKQYLDSNKARTAPAFANSIASPSEWLLNARVALKDIDLGGVRTEIALWGKNLTDSKLPSYGLNFGFAAANNFGLSRTYGIELGIQF